MSTFNLNKRKFGKKPQGQYEIDWGHESLSKMVPIGDATFPQNRSAVIHFIGGIPYAFEKTGGHFEPTTRTGTFYRNAAQVPNSSNVLIYDETDKRFRFHTADIDQTTIVVATVNSYGGGGFGRIWDDNYCDFYLRSSSPHLRGRTNLGTADFTTFVPVFGETYTFVLTRHGTTNSTFSVYAKSGQLIESLTISSGTLRDKIRFGNINSLASRNFDGDFEYIIQDSRLWSDAELLAFVANPAAILKSIHTIANDSVYAALFAGAGTRIITGSGSPTSETATSTGAGLRVITGSGNPQAETATSSGTGTAGSTHTGSGSPQADTATSSGSGLRLIIGSGSPTAERATSTGIVLRIITGSGSTQADNATSSGNAITGNVVQASGSPQAENATSTGVALRIIKATGSVQADTATSTGTGIVSGIKTASGSPQADPATSIGVALRVITCNGSPQAETATCYGTDGGPTIIHPGRIYTVEAENRVYTAETENRSYKVS